MAMKRFRFGGGSEGGESLESINLANVLMLLSRGTMDGGAAEEISIIRGHFTHSPPPPPPQPSSSSSPPGRVFECKTCNRRFPSFQALGGHRASHKKPRTTAAAGDSQADGGVAKPRVHECSVCGLEFAVGQALGGHMRRHRAAAEVLGHGLDERKHGDGRRTGLCLDLNQMPPLENDVGLKKIGLSLEIVDFPMVDCFH